MFNFPRAHSLSMYRQIFKNTHFSTTPIKNNETCCVLNKLKNVAGTG